MNYMHTNRPLYPNPMDSCGRCDDRRQCGCGDHRPRESWRMPLFDCDSCGMNRFDCACSRTVRLENPCCAGEFAEVTLSVDGCGNLVICVHRHSEPCDCRRTRKHC